MEDLDYLEAKEDKSETALEEVMRLVNALVEL